MYSFLQLKKAANTTIDSKEIKLAILGNVSTQFFSLAIQGYAKIEGLNLTVFDADYNQIDIQLADSKSETYQFSPNYILIWLSAEKLYEEFLNLSLNERQNFADKTLNQ